MSVLLITSTKEVRFSPAFVCLFVCYQHYTKTTQLIFTEFGGKVAHWPPKKPLDFGGNPDHVTLGLGLWLGGALPYSARQAMCYAAVV